MNIEIPHEIFLSTTLKKVTVEEFAFMWQKTPLLIIVKKTKIQEMLDVCNKQVDLNLF